MADSIQRTSFYEGQILAAGDLQATVDYSRDQLARHDHLLHSWGITDGLKVELDAAKTGVVIKPGVAIDGTGRELVVLADLRLEASDLQNLGKGAGLYPIFLIGKDQAAQATNSLTGICAVGRSSRINEMALCEFGRPGDELRAKDRTPPAPADGPDGSIDDEDPWKVLIGYAEWDGTKLVDAQTSPTAATVKPQYAGVRADDVTARSGTLTLHAKEGSGAPVVSIAETKDGGEITFRLEGQVDPLFKVDAKGDLTIAGQLKTGGGDAIKPGEVRVETGVATNGMILPLPAGVSPGAAGITVRLIVTPRAPGTYNPDNDPSLTTWGAFPLECSVDPTTRKVRCITRWFFSSGAITKFEDRSGSCDYVVMALSPP